MVFLNFIYISKGFIYHIQRVCINGSWSWLCAQGRRFESRSTPKLKVTMQWCKRPRYWGVSYRTYRAKGFCSYGFSSFLSYVCTTRRGGARGGSSNSKIHPFSRPVLLTIPENEFLYVFC